MDVLDLTQEKTIKRLKRDGNEKQKKPIKNAMTKVEIKTKLKPHQEDGVLWMQSKEKTNRGLEWQSVINKTTGGMVANSCGLGKTLNILALIARQDSQIRANPHIFKNCTLIVCPAGIIKTRVWGEEIKKHTTFKKSQIYFYYGPKRSISDITDETRLIFTSYDIVSQEYNKRTGKFGIGKSKRGKKKKGKKDKEKSKGGSLFSKKFHRIVLDEGHHIRNHKTQKSNATCSLLSKRKWILTGTPLHNELKDMYPYFRFLGYFDNLKDFRAVISNTDEGLAEVRRYLNNTTIRRTTEQIYGNDGELAKAKEEIVYLDFSPQERELYTLLQGYTKSRVNRLDGLLKKMKGTNKDGTIKEEENMLKSIIRNNILVLILRLRQCCCSPVLIFNTMQRLNKVCNISEAIQVLTEYVSNEPRGECGICLDVDEDCILPCKHKLCKKCVVNLHNNYKNRPHAEDDRFPCPYCRALTNTWLPIVSVPTKAKETRQEVKKQTAKEAAKAVEEKAQQVEKSTKIEHLFGQLEEIFARKEKVIVGSQWVMYLNIVVAAFKKRFGSDCGSTPNSPIKYVYLNGESKNRHELIQKFKTDKNCRVCFISLLCASEGITLIEANNVIHLEPYWNNMPSHQLSGRTHRIGQKKQVNISHLRISGTIESNIQQLINKKQKIADAILSGKYSDGRDTGWLQQAIKLLNSNVPALD